METDQHIWREWARILHQWGLESLAASLLDAVGPLGVLGAQVVYVSQPLLDQALPAGHLDALARLLEDQTHVKAFADLLREEPTH